METIRGEKKKNESFSVDVLLMRTEVTLEVVEMTIYSQSSAKSLIIHLSHKRH